MKLDYSPHSTRTAIVAAAVRFSIPSLVNICSRCLFTVRGDIFGIGSGEYIAYGGTVGYEIPF